MITSRALTIGAALAFLAPAAAHGATISTAPCYYSAQRMQINGSGWGPSTTYQVAGQGIFVEGTADDAGNWANTDAFAPDISASGYKPRTFTLTAGQDGTEVATTTFKVVNFLVKPRSLNGKPTGKTTWVFSGFNPGKSIYFHIIRHGKVWSSKAGTGDSPCGTLKRKLRRLPGVPSSQIHYGKYKVYVDNRRKFSKGGFQYGPATITVYKKFV
jgi:hypothetical protein